MAEVPPPVQGHNQTPSEGPLDEVMSPFRDQSATESAGVSTSPVSGEANAKPFINLDLTDTLKPRETNEAFDRQLDRVERENRQRIERSILLANKTPKQIEAIFQVEEWQREAKEAADAEYKRRTTPPNQY